MWEGCGVKGKWGWGHDKIGLRNSLGGGGEAHEQGRV